MGGGVSLLALTAGGWKVGELLRELSVPVRLSDRPGTGSDHVTHPPRSGEGVLEIISGTGAWGHAVSTSCQHWGYFFCSRPPICVLPLFPGEVLFPFRWKLLE